MSKTGAITKSKVAVRGSRAELLSGRENSRCVELLTKPVGSTMDVTKMTNPRQAAYVIRAFSDTALSKQGGIWGPIASNDFDELFLKFTNLLEKQTYDEVMAHAFLEFAQSAVEWGITDRVRKCNEWTRRAIVRCGGLHPCIISCGIIQVSTRQR